MERQMSVELLKLVDKLHRWFGPQWGDGGSWVQVTSRDLSSKGERRRCIRMERASPIVCRLRVVVCCRGTRVRWGWRGHSCIVKNHFLAKLRWWLWEGDENWEKGVERFSVCDRIPLYHYVRLLDWTSQICLKFLPIFFTLYTFNVFFITPH